MVYAMVLAPVVLAVAGVAAGWNWLVYVAAAVSLLPVLGMALRGPGTLLITLLMWSVGGALGFTVLESTSVSDIAAILAGAVVANAMSLGIGALRASRTARGF